MKTVPMFFLICICVLMFGAPIASAEAEAPESKLVTVRLPELPPSRVRVIFSTEDGQHAELEFDPTSDSRLVKSVILPGFTCVIEKTNGAAKENDSTSAACKDATCTWYVSMNADPLYPPDSALRKDGTEWKNLAWKQDTKDLCLSNTETKDICVKVPISDCPQNGNNGITISVNKLPKLEDAAKSLTTSNGGTVAGRSLESALPAAVAETASILAEIALERAKSRTQQIAIERLSSLVCKPVDKRIVQELMGGVKEDIDGIWTEANISDCTKKILKDTEGTDVVRKLFKRAIEERNNSLDKLKQKLDDKNKEIENNKKETREKEQIIGEKNKSLENMASVSSNEIAELNEQLKQLEADKTNLEAKKGILEADIKLLEKDIANLKLHGTLKDNASNIIEKLKGELNSYKVIEEKLEVFSKDLGTFEDSLTSIDDMLSKSDDNICKETDPGSERNGDLKDNPESADAKDQAKKAEDLVEKVKKAKKEVGNALAMVRFMKLLGLVDTPVLPQTCNAVKSLTLDDLATSEKVLRLALQEDLIHLAVTAIDVRVKYIQNQELAEQLVQTFGSFVLRLLRADGKLDSQEAQSMFLELARLAVEQVDTSTITIDPSLRCGMKLAFAVMATCHATDGCDSRMISDMVWNPQNYFSDTKNCQMETLKENWPDLPLFVTQGMRLMNPPRDATPASVAHDAIDVWFQLFEKALEYGNMEPSHRVLMKKAALHARDIAHALVDKDSRRVVSETLPLIGLALDTAITKNCENSNDDMNRKCKALHGLLRASKAAVALSSYAATFSKDTSANEEDKAALREARKTQLQNFIDEFTSREDRWGETIVSIGAPVGFSSYYQFEGPFKRAKYAPPQLSMPTGIGIDITPKATWGTGCQDGKAMGAGGHFHFSIVDITQFLSYDTSEGINTEAPPWWSFVSPGVQIGPTFGPTPNDLFFFGLDFRYLPPELLSTDKGAYRIGLTFSYYVPFFDFN